jgi:hypothetical protein
MNFSDLLVIQKQSKTEIDIFRKHTTINFFSNRIIEYTVATFRYYITRMHSLPLTPERKHKEGTIIQYIDRSITFYVHLSRNYTPRCNINTRALTEKIKLSDI